jgi:hypothetical protein
MNVNASSEQAAGGAARRSGAKSLAILGSLLVMGGTLAASWALPRATPGAAAPAAATPQGDKTPEHTAKAVAAADKFLQGLTDAQRAKATFEFDSPKRAGWSNLPPGIVPRNGVRMGELSKEQRAAALEVVAAVTSKEGYQKVLDIIEADDVLAKGGGKGGKDKGGKGGKDMGFGFDNFYLAFFGKPSATTPWLMEFGGHHLGLNVTVIGKDFVLTPTLTCAQPSSFTRDGKTVRPLGQEVDTAFKLMATLDVNQRAKAFLKGAKDLVLGPGKDGKDIAPEGLKGADMNDKQRELLADLAGCWVTILHEVSAKPRMDEIRAGLKETYFGWNGPTAEGSAAYFRVTGPTVVIEYAPQQGGTNHIHTIVREPGNDYGKKLVKR